MAGAAERLKEAFTQVYGGDRRVRVFRGPGRVNLIGEHTDYNLGFVLPMALELACYVACAPSPDGRLRVRSENLRQFREWTVEELPGLKPAGDWGDYVAGVTVVPPGAAEPEGAGNDNLAADTPDDSSPSDNGGDV